MGQGADELNEQRPSLPLRPLKVDGEEELSQSCLTPPTTFSCRGEKDRMRSRNILLVIVLEAGTFFSIAL